MVMDIRSPNSANATSSLTSQEAEPRRNRVRDNLSFLKLWLRKPASLGAMLPSSKSLASAMAEQICWMCSDVCWAAAATWFELRVCSAAARARCASTARRSISTATP